MRRLDLRNLKRCFEELKAERLDRLTFNEAFQHSLDLTALSLEMVETFSSRQTLVGIQNRRGTVKQNRRRGKTSSRS